MSDEILVLCYFLKYLFWQTLHVLHDVSVTQGHEVAKDFKPYMTDLQIRVQNVSPKSKIPET